MKKSMMAILLALAMLFSSSLYAADQPAKGKVKTEKQMTSKVVKPEAKKDLANKGKKMHKKSMKHPKKEMKASKSVS